MEDTAKNDIVGKIAALIEEHKGQDVVSMDVRQQNSWTDYFVIATATSQAHMRGLVRHVRSFLGEMDIEYRNKYKNIDDSSWMFIDCGFLVVHIMDKEARDFYDLEKLWFGGSGLNHSKSSS